MTTLDEPPVRPVDQSPVAPIPRRGPRAATWLGVAAALAVVVVLAAVAGAVGAAPGAAVFAGLLLAPCVYDAVSRPMFRRLAERNAARRPGEAALVIVGSLLGTAIITASMVVGDTLTLSFRDGARTRLGPIDLAVEVADADLLADVDAAVAASPPGGIDGVVPLRFARGAAANHDPDRPRAEPAVALMELDFDAARDFGGDPSATGFRDAGSTPSGDAAVINERLAETLGVQEGDTIRVFAYGYALPLEVRDVIPELGVAGYTAGSGGGFETSATSPVFIAPGTLDRYADASLVPTASAPVGELLISDEGGVFAGEDFPRQTVDALEASLTTIPTAEVETLKFDMIEGAEETGSSIEEVYSGIGSFSVIAGVLLLVNLFVMLGDERKVQLGMQRAIGFRRSHLCRTFAIEGAVYASIASAAGAVVGVGVGWVINEIANAILGDEGTDLAIGLHVEPASLFAGALAGLAISLLTVWGTSARLSRLNVIAAIRDLPQPRRARQGTIGALLGAAGMVLGVVFFSAGRASEDPVLVMLGVPLALFSLIPVLIRSLPRKPVVVGVSLGVLAWTTAVFSLFPETMAGSEISVFVLMGVLLVGAAVAISSQIDHLWVALNDRLSGVGGGLSARLGLAYPLARKFRTGMLLGMYAIVIFTMTFMSTFIEIFGAQAPQFTEEIAAGYDIFLESSPGNPVTLDQLSEQPEVAAAAPLLFGFPDYEANGEEGGFPLTGFDESLLALGAIGLDARAADYGSDAEVFDAVLRDDSLVVVDDFFLQDGGGPPEGLVGVGDTLVVRNPATDAEHELTVVGVLGSDFVFHGVLAGRPFVEDFLGAQAAEFRHYVQIAPGEDPEDVAATLTGRLVGNGADARTFRDAVDERLRVQQNFFAMIRGFLGLGLIIGIAGLGVVMVRAVRERRREIGMLRAIGFPSRVVRRAFLVEATFIALQGSIIGIGLGLLTTYEVAVNSSTFGEQKMAFEVPWVALVVILVVPLAASLLAVAAPASQAAHIKPAVALRIAD